MNGKLAEKMTDAEMTEANRLIRAGRAEWEDVKIKGTWVLRLKVL